MPVWIEPSRLAGVKGDGRMRLLLRPRDPAREAQNKPIGIVERAAQPLDPTGEEPLRVRPAWRWRTRQADRFRSTDVFAGSRRDAPNAKSQTPVLGPGGVKLG